MPDLFLDDEGDLERLRLLRLGVPLLLSEASSSMTSLFRSLEIAMGSLHDSSTFLNLDGGFTSGAASSKLLLCSEDLWEPF